jgi:hypothetical protein
MNYPYSTATGSISKIMEKLQSVGKPTKADSKWLSSIGITKTSEQRILIILKFLGFTDKKGSPTEIWTNFRSKSNGKKVLGAAIKQAYKELFDIYPNAQSSTKEQLTDFFSTRTDAGNLALTHTVNTYKQLVSYAEFEGLEVIESIEKPQESDSKNLTAPEQKNVPIPDSLSKTLNSKSGITINLNIQLTVPETTDEKVFDKFFESMKKHLLS